MPRKSTEGRKGAGAQGDGYYLKEGARTAESARFSQQFWNSRTQRSALRDNCGQSGFAIRVSDFGFWIFALASLACIGLPASALAETNNHRFACTDYTQGKVFIVAADGSIEWEYQTKSCNDLWVLPNGNVLFNTGHGVQEVTREKQVVFEYQSKSEIYACQRLTNGNTFIGECNSGRLLEVEPSGRIAKEVRLLPEGKDGGHLYMRNARRLANGHYLVTHYGEQVVRDYDAEGKVLREIPAARECSRWTSPARPSGRCKAMSCPASA